MNTAFFEKQQKLIALFSQCRNEESKYNLIIQLGRQLQTLPPQHHTLENQVQGCQSRMYLHTVKENGRLLFSVYSEALISLGLAALLVNVYNGETAETILTAAPDYLETFGLKNSLTPSRANGLYSIHLRMKQDALKHLLAK